MSARQEGYDSGRRGEQYHNPYAPFEAEYGRYLNGYTSGASSRPYVTVFREVPKVSRRGRMSDDRVLFFLRAAHLQDYKYVGVLKATFGLTKDNIDKLWGIALPRMGNGADVHGVHIICRPSQFTRFLIRRNEAGKQNQFKELSPSIFLPHVGMPDNWDVDVSRNPA